MCNRDAAATGPSCARMPSTARIFARSHFLGYGPEPRVANDVGRDSELLVPDWFSAPRCGGGGVLQALHGLFAEEVRGERVGRACASDWPAPQPGALVQVGGGRGAAPDIVGWEAVFGTDAREDVAHDCGAGLWCFLCAAECACARPPTFVLLAQISAIDSADFGFPPDTLSKSKFIEQLRRKGEAYSARIAAVESKIVERQNKERSKEKVCRRGAGAAGACSFSDVFHARNCKSVIC